MAKALDLTASMQLLRKYGIPAAKTLTAKNEKELEKALKAVGFPVVLKVVSGKIVHKTDAGGIKLGIDSKEKALKAFKELKRLAGFRGAVVQEMLKGRELIVGGKRDIQFGPTIIFGLGGIFVEIFRDVSVRICPISKQDAREMVSEIKGYALLKGARGEKPINFKLLEDILLKTSKLMMREKISELDINPLIATGKKIVAVDARVIK